MLKKVLLVLAVVIVGLVAVVVSRPSTFHVERSITIASPVEIPFGLVNDFHNWRFWSPWEALDPKMQKTFDGPYAGPGAIYAWSGNDQVGKGKMTLLETKLNESIRIQLEFLEPWPSTSTTIVTYRPTPEGLQVSWAMEGHNDFVAKAFSMFVDMDSMLGKDFEKGLATLKNLSETEAKNRAERDALIKAKDEAARAAAANAGQPAPGTPAQATTTTP